MVIELVSDTNRGYFNTVWNQYLFFIPAESYEIATGAVNFGCLFLLFGGWFYAVSTLGELFTYGIKGFLKERSILLRFARRIGKWAGKIVRKFKDELLHVDLDGDVEHTLHKIVLVNFIVLGILCSMWFFGWFVLIVYTLALYFLLKSILENCRISIKIAGGYRIHSGGESCIQPLRKILAYLNPIKMRSMRFRKDSAKRWTRR